jgi:hypothetical protein
MGQRVEHLVDAAISPSSAFRVLCGRVMTCVEMMLSVKCQGDAKPQGTLKRGLPNNDVERLIFKTSQT